MDIRNDKTEVKEYARKVIVKYVGGDDVAEQVAKNALWSFIK